MPHTSYESDSPSKQVNKRCGESRCKRDADVSTAREQVHREDPDRSDGEDWTVFLGDLPMFLGIGKKPSETVLPQEAPQIESADASAMADGGSSQ